MLVTRESSIDTMNWSPSAGKKGWRCELFAAEVGTRGFISSSVLSFLKTVGLQSRYRRKALREISFAAEAGSAWIWDKFHTSRGRS